MSELQYCWRCKKHIPMLDESEWERLAPLLSNAVNEIRKYRDKHGVSIAEARTKAYGREALSEYFRLTGYQETNPDALWRHRLAMYGPKCSSCGELLRTQKAKHCVVCGTPRVQ